MTRSSARTVSFKAAAVVFLLAMLIPTIIFQGVLMLIFVPSDSMAPTLISGDLLIGTRIYSSPGRGDIVVFEEEGTLMIKRVVGLPDETVHIAEDGSISIDGELLAEPYVVNQRTGQAQDFVVPEGAYLLLGDNREHSYDARYWDEPYVPASAIRAIAWKRIISFAQILNRGD